MSATYELTILKNAGLNKYQLIRPALVVAACCTMLCYMMSLYLMPMANKKLRLAKENFQYNYSNIMISPGKFETLNNLTIYVRDRQENNRLKGILIYDNSNKEYPISITAKEGNIVNKGGDLLLYLNSGTVQRFSPQIRKSDILNFDSYVINLNEDKEKLGKPIWTANARYLHELLNPEEDTSPRTLKKYMVEVHERLTYPTYSLILCLIATSFLLRGQFNRRGNLKNNLTAIAMAVLFIGSVMVIYDAMERSSKLTPLLYIDLLVFISISLYILRSNTRHITK